MSQFTLVLGTRNTGKRKELEYLLRACQEIRLKTLDEFSAAIEVEETGATFAENAVLKATQQARQLDQWVLGEDSGLSVKALNGAPGVYSARFTGPNASDEENNALLLKRLDGVPLCKRAAWYTCSMALSDPQGRVRISCESCCHGRILTGPRGDAGFGYDPLFEIVEFHLTFGQLGDAVKSVLSHRARANRIFVDKLLRLISQLDDRSDTPTTSSVKL